MTCQRHSFGEWCTCAQQHLRLHLCYSNGLKLWPLVPIHCSLYKNIISSVPVTAMSHGFTSRKLGNSWQLTKTMTKQWSAQYYLVSGLVACLQAITGKLRKSVVKIWMGRSPQEKENLVWSWREAQVWHQEIWPEKTKIQPDKEWCKVAVFKGHVTNCNFSSSFMTCFSMFGRRGGLMVSALDSELNDPGSSPGQGATLCSWARHFTLTVPLSTQVYKWVLANLLLEGYPCDGLASHLGGNSNTLSCLMLRKPV